MGTGAFDHHCSGAESLVGRSVVISDIAGALTAESISIWVVGAPGVGKTAVAGAVEQSLGSGLPFVHLAASSSLSTVPFGALVPLLGELSVRDISSPLAVIRRTVRSLKQISGRKPEVPIIMVDDAHFLDEGSAAILAQVVTAGEGRLFALSRDMPRVPEDIVGLWRDGMVRRVDLDTLTSAEVHEMCVKVLGSNILRSVSGVYGSLSAGNPMFLLALIEQAQRANHLVKRQGVWMLAGERPRADSVLSDLVESELSPLSKAQRKVLELVALAEPLPLRVLRELAVTSDIDALEIRRIISVGPAPQQLVRPIHTLYGEVVRQGMPAARSRMLHRSFVEHMDSEPSSVDGLLRHVGWALECGADVEDRQLLRAAIVANKLYQPSLALYVAESVKEPIYLLAAKVEIARSHYLRGDVDDARELLEGVLESATNLKTVTSAALLSAQLRSRTEAGRRDLKLDADAWRNATERIAGSDTEFHSADAVQLSLTGSRLLALYACSLEGIYPEAETELRKMGEESRGSAETRLAALSLLGETLAATGRPEQGAQANERAMELVAGSEGRLLTYYEFVVSRYAIALIYGGQWDEAQELITRCLAQSPQILAYMGGTVNLITGLVLVRQGLVQSGLTELSPAIAAFRENDSEQLLPLALGVAAYAASLIGQDSLAREFADELFRLSCRGSRQLFLLGQAHAAAARVVMARDVASRDELRQMADEAIERGMASVQLVVLELAVRLEDTSAVRPLFNVATINESAPAVLLSRFASAVLAKDPEGLRKVSDDAVEARCFLVAADCLHFAVSLLEAQGAGQRARQFRAILSELVSRLEGITLYPPREGYYAPDLTRRERVIATLVLEGRSNKSIAEVLSVSVRTIEGHLYRIFAKLGISHRQDLTQRHVNRRNE